MINILVAADLPVVRRGVKEVLKNQLDMTVTGEAGSVADFMELVRTSSWDLAILDYTLLTPHGVRVLRRIQRRYPSRGLLVINVSAGEANAAELFNSGCAGYLATESAAEELGVAVNAVMRGERYISPVLAEKLADELASKVERPRYRLLSDREYRVMLMLATGRAVKDIAGQMHLCPSTVSTYRSRIFRKLVLDNNAQLVQYAVKHHLLN